jgi:hypothetical protein
MRLSQINVLFALSGIILIYSSGLEANTSLFVNDKWRTLSRASDELEINSRKKMSLFE